MLDSSRSCSAVPVDPGAQTQMGPNRSPGLLSLVAGIMSAVVVLIGACEGGSQTQDLAPANSASPPAAPEPTPTPENLPDEAWAAKYVDISRSVLGNPDAGSDAPGRPLDDRAFEAARSTLRDIIASAKDPHLKANAGMLLGSIHETRGDRKIAISYYKQAVATVSNEAEPRAVLALALAAEQRFGEAIKQQEEVAKLVPDDLQAWLLLGELNIKAGRAEQAKLAYAAYEARRKGLLDGLTLKKDGKFLKEPAERAQCAFLLGVARDEGTALGLAYALKSESDSSVLAALVQVMGEQRLAGYQKMLEAKRSEIKDDVVRKRIDWALAEIARDPVQLKSGVAPKADLQAAEPGNPLGSDPRAGQTGQRK